MNEINIQENTTNSNVAKVSKIPRIVTKKMIRIKNEEKTSSSNVVTVSRILRRDNFIHVESQELTGR